ncbi:MAG: c-type cytochrome [candidate division Zixibacteria bacterium]|nr:c-type cytochrome [candidate division Zixibacteria bacterium]
MNIANNRKFSVGLVIAALSILALVTSCDFMNNIPVSSDDLTYIEKTIFFSEEFRAIPAHMTTEFWEKSDWPEEFLEASCGTCHLSEEVPKTSLLTQGRILFREKGCISCHSINDFYEDKVDELGPDLNGIGNKVNRGWLYHWLKDPHNYLENPRMPTFRLDDQKLFSLIEYLMSLDDKDSPPVFISEMPVENGDPDRGDILVRESRCISCHSIHGRGGTFAPELERVGDKVKEEWLPNFLRNIHYYQPRKKMLAFNFSSQEALDIAAYFFDEFTEDDYLYPQKLNAAQAALSPEERQQKVIKGKQIFWGYGCRGCHNVADIPKLKVGTDLSNIGNRSVSSLYFGDKDDVARNLHNWIFMKIKNPIAFDSLYNMPNFNLTDQEALAITVALLGNKEKEYPPEFLVHELESSPYTKPPGKFGELFERYSCISCHTVEKYGGTLSTVSLTNVGSRVKYEWLKNYLLKPFAVRPIVTARMPRFRMTEADAEEIARYLKEVYVSREIPKFLEHEFTAEDENKGRNIFEQQKCVSCHIVDGQGGYVGPSLDNLAQRLETGWVYKWLRNPQKYQPRTIHPNYGFSEKEAKQLTAFLIRKQAEPK